MKSPEFLPKSNMIHDLIMSLNIHAYLLQGPLQWAHD